MVGKTGRKRIRRQSGRLKTLVTILVLLNIFALIAIALLVPEIPLGKLQARVDIEASSVLITLNGTGWYKPPVQYNLSEIPLYILIRDSIIGSASSILEDVGGEKTAFYDFNISFSLDYKYFKNLTVHPELRVRPGVEPYVDMPANAVIPEENGCFLLVYALAYSMNITMEFCYYYIDPYLIIENNETGTLLLTLEIHRVNNTNVEKRVVSIPGKTTRRIELEENTRVIIRDIQLDYGLFKVNEYISDEEKLSGIVVGEKKLFLARNPQLVLIPLNLAILLLYLLYSQLWKKSRMKKK